VQRSRRSSRVGGGASREAARPFPIRTGGLRALAITSFDVLVRLVEVVNKYRTRFCLLHWAAVRLQIIITRIT